MKKKIIAIVIVMLLAISGIQLVFNDVNVEADPGGGESGNGGIQTLNDYVWNMTKEVSNVVRHAEYLNDIPRGRAWATAGEDYTIENILRPELEETLTGFQKLLIGPISGKLRQYSSKIVLNDYGLTIQNDSSEEYPFAQEMPYSELFPMGIGVNSLGNDLDGVFDYEDVIIEPYDLFETYPFSGTYNNYYYNLSSEILNVYDIIVGYLVYVNTIDDIPVNQTGITFILEEEPGCEEKIENMTTASGCILINNESRTYCYQNSSQNKLPVVRVNESDSNLTLILNELSNETGFMVDNVYNNETLVFTYNFSDNPFGPSDNWVGLVSRDAPSERNSAYYDFGKLLMHQLAWRIFNSGPDPVFEECEGFILYDFPESDTHFMSHTVRNWGWFLDNPDIPLFLDGPFSNRWFFPTFSINNSVGEWLNNHYDTTTLSGFIDQNFKKQTLTSPGVKSYNVVGYRNISQSPGDGIVVLSNRIDGWWGETPGDSGAGCAILLGIAKYFHEYDITPKYNLTFLFTTGEEYGMRGAQHYNDSHPDEENNFTRFIGFDQLCFNYTVADHSLNTSIGVQNEDDVKIISAIANDTDYIGRTGYGLDISIPTSYGSEDLIWKDRCPTVGFGKDNDSSWDGYHRSGMNYISGDSLSNIDRNDVNLTFELAWEVIKYYTVNPNCWFYNDSVTVFDSPDDKDSLNDSVRFNFTINTSMPHDITMIDAYLAKSGEKFDRQKINYTVTSDGVTGSITCTVPETAEEGSYGPRFLLYNSTGRINEIVGIEGTNYNDTGTTTVVYLYPLSGAPEIYNVSNTPEEVGFGQNTTIYADVSDNQSGLDTVKVNITYPDDSYGNFTMEGKTSGGFLPGYYVFNDTWQVGQYNFTIWALDNAGVSNTSSGHSFNVSVNATISVCTIKDTYGSSEYINITDPPGGGTYDSDVGYELLDDGNVLHIWNKFDSYYFNTTSGIQLTNHYDEYWSHNVLMLGYYNNDQWNLLYRTDELSGFNKDVDSDNETFVNATLWKDLSYGGYDFRLAIRYHLGVDDNELTVIPYIKNIDTENIPYTLGFGWELNDIQVDMTETGDFIVVGNESYLLNQTLDNSYTNLFDPVFYIMENITETTTESLYLRWDKDLNYRLQVKSRTGEYNAPVTLFVRIGTLDVGQEKYAEMFWYDVSKVTYYFNSVDDVERWETNHGYMVDGDIGTFASTTGTGDVELCDGNSYSGGGSGVISMVELRARTYYQGVGWGTVTLRPVFGGTSDGDNHQIGCPGSAAWSSWFDLAKDTNAPGSWSWSDVASLDCDVVSSVVSGGVYCSKVEVQVTYTPNSTPGISNPYPADDSVNVSLQPMLSITVSDDEEDSMDITWLSNSSGSWQVFGTNNSVHSGSYHQVMVNASANGQWWYWKVNVSDGTNNNESDVYRFYTGVQSKIVNTGSTNISGYLLIQVQYQTVGDPQNWVVDNDTVNETTPRTINAGDQLGLDTIFNGLVSTDDLTHGDGTYRIYAAFRDPDGDVLICNDASKMDAWWEFEVDTT